jgi:hypothetical protein
MQSCHVCQKQIACNEEESIYGNKPFLEMYFRFVAQSSR